MAKKRSTKSSAFHPTADMRVVLLHGRERFLMTEYTRLLIEALESVHGEIARFEYDGAEADLAAVLDELRSYGLMQPHKLVIVDNADQFVASGEDRTRRTALENYAKSPVEHSSLLLRAETWRKSNLDTLIEKVGAARKVDPPSSTSAMNWLKKRAARRYDVTIEDDAAWALVERVDVDMATLDSELAKMATFVGAGGTITTNEVEQMVGLSREQRAWVLQEPIAAGRSDDALRTLHELLVVSRQPEELIMWAMMDLMRKIHAAGRLLADGANPGAIRSELRLFGDAAHGVLNAARRLSPTQAADLFHAVVEADRRRKSGYGTPQRTLETLACKVADTIGRA